MRLDLPGQERLLISPPAAAAARRGVLLFPQSYGVGMASLALHTLYAALNATGEMAWERVFAGPGVAQAGRGALCSLESGTPLREFDVIAITSSYELDWPTVPAALAAGGVAPLRQDRRAAGGPLVLMGGPAISAAPLPLAAIYDAAYIGEVEPVLPELRGALLLDRREETLERLAAIPGFFVPESPPVGRAAAPAPPTQGSLPRRYARHLDDFETASVFLTPGSEFPHRFLVEIGRGCGRSCRFCLARQLYRPLRWRSLSCIMETVRRGLQYTNEVGFIAAAVSDYPDLPGLCAALEALPPQVSLSTSSIRLETASAELLGLLAHSGQKTVTFAPEAATERLRAAIGKSLPDDALCAAIERAAAAGLTRVRLYCMVGLPTETAEDREALPALARRLTEMFPRLVFHYSVGAFSPRPHTPFELEPLPPLRDLRNWLATAQRRLQALRRVEVTTDSARWAALQAVFSRSDERLGMALARRHAGNFSELVQSLAAESLAFEELTGPQDPGGPLPWKIVDPHPRGLSPEDRR